MNSNKISAFMKTPLVAWVKTFQENGDNFDLDCNQLFNGIFLDNVWHQIDTNSSFVTHAPIDENDSSKATRIRALSALLYKIRSFYSDSLGQVLLLKLPDVINIGKNPEDECNIEDLHIFLLLILGSAVQCEQKEHFIEKIKSMDVSIQHSIVECIQQITDNPSSVWINSEWSDLSQIPDCEQSRMYSILVQNVNRLVQERDELLQRVVELVLEIENFRTSFKSTNTLILKSPCSNQLPNALMMTNGSFSSEINQATSNSSLYNFYSTSSCRSSLSPGSNNDYRSHLMLELAEVKSKLRKIQQELEEKTELVAELKEILDLNKETCNKLRQENLELIQESRSAKAYRDEIDVLNERVRKVDRLEGEVQKYRDKMNELEFCKSRIEEMREDNRILTETKSMLEEQLEGSRKRLEIIPDLESQILQLRAYSNELSFQQDIDKNKIESLLEELTILQVDKKAVVEELAKVQCDLDLLRSQLNAFESMGQNGIESNLLEQLNNDAAKRVLKLEFENQKLQSLVENFKNNKSDFVSSSLLNSNISKLNFDGLKDSTSESDERLDSPENMSENDSGCVSLVGELNLRLEKMEKENQRLKNIIEQLKESEFKLAELESSKSELQKLNDECKSKLSKELLKIEQLESTSFHLNSENQRLLRQIENISKELEDSHEEVKGFKNENQKLQETSATLKEMVKKLNEMEKDLTNLKEENNRLEQEKKSSEKEILRLKQAIDLKNNQLDQEFSKLSSLEVNNKKMYKKIETLTANICNAKELEKENKEINQELIVSKKSLATLRQDLVEEKIKSQNFSSELERIGMALSHLNIKSSLPSSLSSSSSISLSLSSSSSSPISNSSTSSNLIFSSPTTTNNTNSAIKTCLSEIGKTDWSKLFHNVIKSKVREIVEDKEEKIDLLEKKLTESDHLRSKLESELETVKQKMKFEETQGNDVIDISLLQRMEDLEKRLNLTENENKNLKNENLTLKKNESSLKTELKSMQLKINCMSKQSNDLHSDQAKVQVENSLLLAQKSSLSSQAASLYSQIQTLEESKNNLESKCKQFEENYQTLITDHQSLQTLHQQLVNDYEVLIENHSLLKSNHKLLKVEHKEMKEKLDAWLLSNEELKKIIKDQTECSKTKETAEEVNKLKEENRTLFEDYKKVETELKMVQNIYKQLRKEHNDLKLKHTELEGETAEYRNKMSSLQIEISKLSDYCESLLFANSLLENHRKLLLSNVASLLSKYHRFITDLGNREKNQGFSEKVAELLVTKDKLEKMIKDYELMSERKKNKIVSSAPKLILAKQAQKAEVNGHRTLCPTVFETKGEIYDKLWESNTAVLQPILRSKTEPILENSESSPPPRPPPRTQALNTTVENKMTINMITSPTQKQYNSNIYSSPSSTSSLPSNFVRSTFRSNSINIGSSFKNYSKDRNLIQLPTLRSNHYFHHHLHYYHQHQIHFVHPAPPSNNSEEDSELSDGINRINEKNDTQSLISKTGQSSLNNSTWYEYGCV